MKYSSGLPEDHSYKNWIGLYANGQYTHFARHDTGIGVDYTFNNDGFRGPEFFNDPDISVFGSSFSFGVGMEFNNCWHQNLGNYKVNCYATAGFLMRNKDILEMYNDTCINSGMVILQFRETKYDDIPFVIPANTLNFIVDVNIHNKILTLPYNITIDKAIDNTHPGKETHIVWSNILKREFKL